MTLKDTEKAAQKAADYLYKIEGDCPPELYEAIATLRQLINEEFKPARQISSQFIYDVLYPKLSNFISKDEILKARPANRELIEPVTKRKVKHGEKVGIDLEADTKGSLKFIQDNGYNMALKDWSKALGIGE